MEKDIENIISNIKYYFKFSDKLSLVSIQIVPGEFLEDVKYFQNYKIILNEIVKIKINESNIFKRILNKLMSREYIDKKVVSKKTVPAFIQYMNEERKVVKSLIGCEGNIFDTKYYNDSTNYNNIIVILGKGNGLWNTVFKLPSLEITVIDKFTDFIEKHNYYFKTEEEMNRIIDFIVKENNNLRYINGRESNNIIGIKEDIKNIFNNFKNLYKNGK